MDYTEAAKRVSTRKPKENYLMVEISYGKKFILPFKDGMAFIASMANAEQLHDPYNEPHRIQEIERESIKTTVMSYDEYERFKIAALLNIDPKEVKDLALQSG